jgi:formamidopyrimidine-DNA glycosylase
MPELPDVEELKQYMDATSLYKAIKKAEVRDTQVLENVTEKKLERALKGNKFKSTRRHGKYLFVNLSSGKFLLMHFGMTGALKYFKDENEEPEHTRLLISFKNGYYLAYDNQRKLGKLDIIKNVADYIKKNNLGMDALDPDFNFQKFKESTKGKRAMIKSFLMNQKIVAGIGNIYSDEILFQAKIYPKTRINTLSEKELKKLFKIIKDVMKRSIDKRANPDKLPDSFIIPHRNKGDKCPVCGKEIDKITVSGRSAYYCPRCQKK